MIAAIFHQSKNFVNNFFLIIYYLTFQMQMLKLKSHQIHNQQNMVLNDKNSFEVINQI
jgi:hypothetical protein